MYKTCYIRNISDETLIFCGQEMPPDYEYQITDQFRIIWADDDAVLGAICDSVLQVGNGINWLEGLSNQINYLKDLSDASS